jgi:putative membrane protein
MMHYRTVYIASVAALIVACFAPSMGMAADVGAPKEKDFLAKASEAQKAELAFGLMASDRAESSKVKQFGRRMIEDHQKAGMKVKQLALKESIDLPAGMPPMQKEKPEQFSRPMGEDFDRAYIGYMLKEHKRDVEAFEHSANGLKDHHVQKWATETLPVLKEHLKVAETIAEDLKINR